jgi:hypothetical protein
MSKKCAKRLAGPFSSTSHHHRLCGSAAMWLGTMSSTWPSPASRSAAVIAACAPAPPRSSLMRVGSTTS